MVEYRVIHVGFLAQEHQEQRLNELAKQRWRLRAVCEVRFQGLFWYLEREVQ